MDQRVTRGQRHPSDDHNPDSARADATSSATQRLRQIECDARQEMLTGVALSTLPLALFGYLPATIPSFSPLSCLALALVVLLLVAAIIANRMRRVDVAVVCYIAGLVGLEAAALFLAPAGPHAALSITRFTAGNLYYLVAGVLPVLASLFLLSLPWAMLISAGVLTLNAVCIWILPHDASFDRFTTGIGGSPFAGSLILTASLVLGQGVLVVFGLSIQRAMRRTLLSAARMREARTASEQSSDLRAPLLADIALLQQTLARVANGEVAQAVLSPSSELYPIAVSLNLMAVRLTRLSRADIELRDLERGLAEASQVITRLNQGDLLTQPAPTGTMVDGLLASLVQVQGHIATWIQGLASGLRDAKHASGQAMSLAEDVAETIKRAADASTVSATAPAADATAQTEQLVRLLHGMDTRLRYLADAMDRIQAVRAGGAVGRLMPVETLAWGDPWETSRGS